MLITEYAQMKKYRNIDINKVSKEKLVCTILNDISVGKILSSHFTKDEASEMLNIIEL